jgi:hypothetical protein
MEATTCECGRLADPAVIGMGHHEEVFRTLDQIHHRGSPWWWLLSFRCRACGQDWLVASEERQNDVYILRRLDRPTAERIILENVWPSDFDRYETLLAIGRAAGHSVRFFDVADSPLLHTIADLAKERPGIRVSELASLLNLDQAVAADLARQVVAGRACCCFVCRAARVAGEEGHQVAAGSVNITLDVE